MSDPTSTEALGEENSRDGSSSNSNSSHHLSHGLDIEVLWGEGFTWRRSDGKRLPCNPRCLMRVMEHVSPTSRDWIQTGELARTSIKYESANPDWNEKFDFTLQSLDSKLEISVVDTYPNPGDKKRSKMTLIGQCEIRTRDLHVLFDRTGTDTTKLRLEVRKAGSKTESKHARTLSLNVRRYTKSSELETSGEQQNLQSIARKESDLQSIFTPVFPKARASDRPRRNSVPEELIAWLQEDVVPPTVPLLVSEKQKSESKLSSSILEDMSTVFIYENDVESLYGSERDSENGEAEQITPCWGQATLSTRLGSSDRDALVEIQFLKLAQSMLLFKDLKPHDISELSNEMRSLHFLPGEKILTAGSKASSMFIVVLGRVLVVRDQKPLASLQEGDYFGDAYLLRSSAVQWDVISLSGCSLLELESVGLFNLQQRSPLFASTLLGRLRDINIARNSKYGIIERVFREVHPTVLHHTLQDEMEKAERAKRISRWHQAYDPGFGQLFTVDDQDAFAKEVISLLGDQSILDTQAIEVLKQSTVFRTFNTHAMAKVAERFRKREFNMGELIMQMDSPADSFFVVQEGRVMLSKSGRAELFLGPGTVLGEVGILSGKSRRFTVSAIEKCSVLQMMATDLWELGGMFPGLIQEMAQVAHDRVAQGNERYEKSISLKKANSRFAMLRPVFIPDTEGKFPKKTLNFEKVTIHLKNAESDFDAFTVELSQQPRVVGDSNAEKFGGGESTELVFRGLEEDSEGNISSASQNLDFELDISRNRQDITLRVWNLRSKNLLLMSNRKKSHSTVRISLENLLAVLKKEDEQISRGDYTAKLDHRNIAGSHASRGYGSVNLQFCLHTTPRTQTLWVPTFKEETNGTLLPVFTNNGWPVLWAKWTSFPPELTEEEYQKGASEHVSSIALYSKGGDYLGQIVTEINCALHAKSRVYGVEDIFWASVLCQAKVKQETPESTPQQRYKHSFKIVETAQPLEVLQISEGQVRNKAVFAVDEGTSSISQPLGTITLSRGYSHLMVHGKVEADIGKLIQLALAIGESRSRCPSSWKQQFDTKSEFYQHYSQ